MNTTTPTEILSRLAHRLVTQQGGRGKIERQFLRRQARLGRIGLPSGHGRTVSVTASL